MTLRLVITRITFLFILLFMINATLPITIRLMQENEIDWINQRYDEVQFQHSHSDDIIAIAEINNAAAGIGRLVRVDRHNYELGGIYVFEEYRNQKIATYIVNFLLDSVKDGSTIFCIPFKYLSHFYKKFCFEEVIDLSIVPKKILSKYEWCKQAYQDAVGLLIKIK